VIPGVQNLDKRNDPYWAMQVTSLVFGLASVGLGLLSIADAPGRSCIWFGIALVWFGMAVLFSILWRKKKRAFGDVSGGPQRGKVEKATLRAAAGRANHGE